jgi:hypothetical protein
MRLSLFVGLGMLGIKFVATPCLIPKRCWPM